jgi:hypothetical protein
LLRHKRLGNRVAVSQCGRVVWLAPEEIPAALEEPGPGGSIDTMSGDSGTTDPEFDDLALLLLYLASWEEKGVAGRRAWKGVPFETLDVLTERGFLEGSRAAKSVWLTPEGIARAREVERRLLHRDSTPETGVLLEPGTAFELRVTLRGIDPPIWRRVRVPADIELPALHEVLQRVMGWTNSHLHEFRVGGVAFGDPEEEDDYGPIDERRVRLSQLVRHVGDLLTYVYDVGDDWEHDVVLERFVRDPGEAAALVCLGGTRACPPEDVGGTGGYSDFLAAIADPEHEEHDQCLEWVGGRFDPDGFDLEAINRALSRSVGRPRRSGGRPRR